MIKPMNKNTPNQDYMNLRLAAECYGVAYRTMHNWVMTRQIPSYKLLGKRLVKKTDIDAMIERTAPVNELVRL